MGKITWFMIAHMCNEIRDPYEFMCATVIWTRDSFSIYITICLSIESIEIETFCILLKKTQFRVKQINSVRVD